MKQFLKYISTQKMKFDWEHCPTEQLIGAFSYKLRWNVNHIENEFKHIRDELNYFFSNGEFLKIILCIGTKIIQCPIDGWDREYEFNSQEPFVNLLNTNTFEYIDINSKFIVPRKGFMIRYKFN